MPVVELLVSAFLPVLLERLTCPQLQQFLRQEGLYSKIKKWEKMLLLIQAVLADAEEKQLTNTAVKTWLDDLRDLAYDAEDMLDEFATEAFSRKLKMEQEEEEEEEASKDWKLVPAFFSNWKFSIRMKSNVKDVTRRFDQLCKLRQDLGLKVISVSYCRNLKSVPKGLHNLIHLRKIEIYYCESIDCLGEEGHPNTNLSEVAIGYCEKLKSLPNWFHGLKSLKSLRLSGCPNMTWFSDEGFPTNLTSLGFDGEVKMFKAVLEWGLHNLTSLTSLWIRGFPQQEMEMTFPPCLTHLYTLDFPNLKCHFGNLNSLEHSYISSCQNLTSFLEKALPSSLKYLWIKSCPNLKSFSKVGLPSSLSILWIWECPQVRSFPEQGLPSSHSKLKINDCPNLKEECKRDTGKKWSKISHIPCIDIVGKNIYDPEEESEEEEL